MIDKTKELMFYSEDEFRILIFIIDYHAPLI
jgi:hypothetical protein